jgi:hypothetical protein
MQQRKQKTPREEYKRIPWLPDLQAQIRKKEAITAKRRDPRING